MRSVKSLIVHSLPLNCTVRLQTVWRECREGDHGPLTSLTNQWACAHATLQRYQHQRGAMVIVSLWSDMGATTT